MHSSEPAAVFTHASPARLFVEAHGLGAETSRSIVKRVSVFNIGGLSRAGEETIARALSDQGLDGKSAQAIAGPIVANAKRVAGAGPNGTTL